MAVKLHVAVSARGHGGTSESELAKVALWENELFAEDQDIINGFVWHDGSGQGFNIQTYWDGEFVGFGHVFPRVAHVNGVAVLMGALGGVMTAKEFQGVGVGSATVTKANQVIRRSLQADLGVLLCKSSLVAFYERLGWEWVSAPVSIEQPTGKVKWPYEAMVLPGEDLVSTPEELDLCGLPF